jgi:CRP-like cAMP-binding protein
MEPHRVTHSLVKALRAVPDFADLDDATLLRIVGASTNLFYPAGSVAFEPGSPAEALYVVLSGEVRIFDRQDGSEVEVSRVRSGDSFGEFSMLMGTEHSKTAQATDDTELMVIPRESFRQVLADAPELDAKFQRRLQERLSVRGQVSESA